MNHFLDVECSQRGVRRKRVRPLLRYGPKVFYWIRVKEVGRPRRYDDAIFRFQALNGFVYAALASDNSVHFDDANEYERISAKAYSRVHTYIRV